MKLFKHCTVWLVAVFMIVGFGMTDVKAGHADNKAIVYYTMANQAYAVPNSFEKNGLTKAKIMQQITTQINNQIAGKDNSKSTKYQVVDIISTNVKNGHAMGKQAKTGKIELAETGLNAVTAVDKGSKKLWIGIAGTSLSNEKDLKTAYVAATSSNRAGQEYHLMLYLNYIYNTFPAYRGYKWYLSGHSLGGNLAVQTYMNVDAKITNLVSKNYVHTGGFKHKFSGVYAFNPLPITKGKITTAQWNANLKGKYDSQIYNYVLENEWLHTYLKASNYNYEKLGKGQLRTAYIGTAKEVETNMGDKAKKTSDAFAKSYKDKSLKDALVKSLSYDALKDLHGRTELNKALGTKFYDAGKPVGEK